MRRLSALFAILFLHALSATAADPAKISADSWPQWRGPSMTGHAPEICRPPVEWSEDTNIKWKAEVPGSGVSTPIVWGDRIFLLTAIEIPSSEPEKKEAPPEQASEDPGEGRRGRRGGGFGGGGEKPKSAFEFTVLALNRADGSLAWKQVARKEVPHEGIHQNGSWASASPVTDGEHLFAFFGSHGLYCYDLDGTLQWEKDFGNMTIKRGFGEASSPALYGDTVVINWDHEGDSFIVAVDKRTGEQKWKVDRDETTSWSSPLIVEVGGVPQVVTNATNRVRGYDLANGNLLWECSGMTQNVIPTPVSLGERVFVTSGFRGSALFAIDLPQAKGDITDSPAIAWKGDKGTPYISSPLLDGSLLYLFKDRNPILSCFDVENGETVIDQERIPDLGDVYASPVAAQDHVYLLGREGTMVVLKAGPKLEVVATNNLEGIFAASPAIMGNEMFLRSDNHLYCLVED